MTDSAWERRCSLSASRHASGFVQTTLSPVVLLGSCQIANALTDIFLPHNRQGPVWTQIGVIEWKSAVENGSLST